MRQTINLPAKAASIFNIGRKAGRIHQQLFRHTATDNASSTRSVSFDHRNLGTMTSGDAASTNAARPCANHNQIIVKILLRLGHDLLPLAAD